MPVVKQLQNGVRDISLCYTYGYVFGSTRLIIDIYAQDTYYRN